MHVTERARDIAHQSMQAGAAQKLAEFEQLAQLIMDFEPISVLEIGTMTGGTLKAWCQCAAPNARIVSVDLPGGEWGGGYTETDIPRLRGYARPGQHLDLIRADSHDTATLELVAGITLGRGYDFIFIDGDHTLEGVTQDFHDYAPLARRGGLVAFHDVLHHPRVPRCQVSDLWESIKGAYPERWEFCVDGDERTWGPWGGIGVIEWPG